jgi:fido (protein-threonine AMPylation protein)
MDDYKTRVAVGRGLAHNYLADQGCMNPKPEMMLEAHRRMFAGATTDAGQFRKPGQLAMYGGIQGAEPQRVGVELSRLHSEMFELTSQSRTPEDCCAAIAFYHARMIGVHPFHDGNGRVGRMIMESQANTMGMKFDMSQISRDKPAYIAALNVAMETNDIAPLTKVVAAATGVKLEHKGELIAASRIKSRPMMALGDICPLDEEREMVKTGMPPPLPSVRAQQLDMGPSM